MEKKAKKQLRYGFTSSYLGEILIARSDVGVAAVLLGDDHTALVRQLVQAWPGAEQIEDQEAVHQDAATIAELIANPRSPAALPLDLLGSDLERAVWAALCAIPLGETRTYGAIAEALPMPATAQEVGAACAANRVALLVPCHRVVKADGSISGYRWGVHRKRRLINREACA